MENKMHLQIVKEHHVAANKVRLAQDIHDIIAQNMPRLSGETARAFDQMTRWIETAGDYDALMIAVDRFIKEFEPRAVAFKTDTDQSPST